MKARYIVLILLITVARHASGEEVQDTLFRHDQTVKFRPQKVLLPASLIAVGSWGVCSGWFQTVNQSVRNEMTRWRGNRYIHADDYIQYLPVISHVGLGTLGVKSRHPFKERLIAAATSYLAMGIMTNSIKWAVNEKRPDSPAENSFPSGHTATVFMGAELVRMECGAGYGIGVYAIAGGVAFLRLYNDRHWLNDVIAGAGIGILSARIGYWLLPLNRKLFRLNKKNSPAIATVPAYYPQSKSWGIAITAQF